MTTVLTPVDGFELITLAEAKRQLRLDADFDDPDYDEQIPLWIEAAVQAAADYTERNISDETLVVTLDAFKRTACFDDWRPLQKSDIAVQYVPVGGTGMEDLPVTDYTLSKWNGGYQVFFANEFAVAHVANAIVITANCKVPATVKQACLLKLSDFDTFREDRPAFDNGNFEKLLRPYRKY